MEAIAVNVRRAGQSERVVESFATELARAKRLATLLDAQFEFAGIKFGMDAIIGLVPVIGDTIAFAAGLYPIHLMRKHKLSRATEMRMWLNLAIDYFGGLVPVVGDMFDVSWKANLKNVQLLEAAAAKAGRR